MLGRTMRFFKRIFYALTVLAEGAEMKRPFHDTHTVEDMTTKVNSRNTYND